MNKLEDYEKYLGGYIRNQFGIAKIINVFEEDGTIILKLDKKIVYNALIKTGEILENQILSEYYPITKYTQNLDERIKPLIELIEPGDYVNGKLIHKVEIKNNSAYIYYGNCKTFVDYQIKDVVTHEQFEKVKYRLEDWR